MIDDTIVTMRFYREHVAVVPNPDTWRFAITDGWALKRRLQRLAWWFLHKTRALSNGVMDETTYHEIRFKSITALNLLLEARRPLLEAHRKPTRVLVGPDVMEEIMQDPQWQTMMQRQAPLSFTAPMRIGHPPERRGDMPRLEVYGMRITIVPWMRGMVVLDEDCLR